MDNILKLIEKHYNEKKNKNSNYSLRAYAKHLGISPATLSRILSKQAKVTPKIFNIISPKLDLSIHQKEVIGKQLQSKKQEENIRRVEVRGISLIDMEKFNVIADWYHYAILHMCSLESFKSDHEWIAERLGITDTALIDNAIARLLEYRLMGIDQHDRYFKLDQFSAILDYEYSSIAMRERQKQILKLSSEKIDSIPISMRDHSSLTINVDEDLLPEIKDRIKKFRRTLGNFIVKNNVNTTQVYELQLGFFPLLKKED